MRVNIEDEVRRYLRAVKAAGNEEVRRQRFVALLQSLFGHLKTAKPVIEDFVAGAERVVTKIRRPGRRSDRGRADTQYGSVIIEFENDLSKTGGHAKEQLADYVTGNWNSGSRYQFTLIASDCVTWKIHAPDIDHVPGGTPISSSDIKLMEKDSFTLTESNCLEFYHFLDSILFRAVKKRPTLAAIKNDFGEGSNAFITAVDQLTAHFTEAKSSGEVTVAYEQWERFLSVAYDKFDGSERVFLVHTYLSVFAKMLVYKVLTGIEFIDDVEMGGILTGGAFEILNIRNFTDNDFFHWVSSERSLKALKPMFRAISAEFDSYDFGHIDEDILKGVYQDLIDRDTRHSLGEYYTPDWLCETIVGELEFGKDSRVLDPSCGSGSFLRAAIEKFIIGFPRLSADEIASRVSGLDIHPLSVQISKATVLLALKDKVAQSPKPVFLGVHLANTLLSPSDTASLSLFGETFNIWIDDTKVAINTRVFDDPPRFEEAVHAAERVAEITKGENDMGAAEFDRALRGIIGKPLEGFFSNGIHDIYRAFKAAKEADRNGIWEFIVRNLYKPCFFHRGFDFVVGNPPWFTFSSIGNANYQDLLKEIARNTGTWPAKKANAPHMEISAIFLAHCTDYFLKDKGTLAFVLPRSFFQADHHDNTRSGSARFVRVKEIWDLEDVSPLFNVPSCVIIAERASGSRSTAFPKRGRVGRHFSGRLENHNANLKEVRDRLKSKKVTFHYSKLGAASAFTTKKIGELSQTNHYKDLFRQGATLVPRNFYFIEPTQNVEGSFKGRIFTAKTCAATDAQAKPPWKGIIIRGRISGDYLYRTALSQNILPFVLHDPPLVLLPTRRNGSDRLALLDSRSIMESGGIDTAIWFRKVEAEWLRRRTERNLETSNIAYLDWRSKLTSQPLNVPYVVVYTSSSKDASSVVIARDGIDLDFVVESATYAFFTRDDSEAHYLSAFLNSNHANSAIKHFQSKGLFGPRHIHKLILDLALPRFDPDNATHAAISELGRACHDEASAYLAAERPESNLSPHALGRHRLAIRGILGAELDQVDVLFRSL